MARILHVEDNDHNLRPLMGKIEAVLARRKAS
jgi:hypothetical protein